MELLSDMAASGNILKPGEDKIQLGLGAAMIMDHARFFGFFVSKSLVVFPFCWVSMSLPHGAIFDSASKAPGFDD